MKKPVSRMIRLVFVFVCTLFVFLSSAHATDKDKDKDDGPGPDAYTRMKAKAIKALGYERYGPFSLSDSHTSQDVEKLIGADWRLWVETPHFKIGSTLTKRPIVNIDRDASGRLKEELARLKKKLPRHVKKFEKLDEWLLLQLYAQRLEELFDEMSARFAVDDQAGAGGADGADADIYIGWKNKFTVLLFEQKANLARYLARFAGMNRDTACRHWCNDSKTMLLATSREHFATWPDEDTAFLCHVTANMIHVFIHTYGGYKYRLPLWWGEGLKHWYLRRINPEFFNPTTAPGQKLDYRQDHEWNKKVYSRIRQDYFRPARELLAVFDPKEMDFADHMMVWSRVDYLLTLGNKKAGRYMEIMKTVPWVAGKGPKDILAVQEEALMEAWGLDPDTLDEKWTRWVLKEYKNFEKRRK